MVGLLLIPPTTLCAAWKLRLFTKPATNSLPFLVFDQCFLKNIFVSHHCKCLMMATTETFSGDCNSYCS